MARRTAPFRARLSFPESFGPIAVCAIATLFAPSGAAAQEPPDSDQDPPAHVAFVDGTAVLERDGRADTAPENMPLLAGDRIRTRGGRVEILFADGSTLHLDANTTVDFQSDDLVRLLEGRLRLTIAGSSRAVSYRIDAPGAWAQISQPGEYRLSVLRGAPGRAAGEPSGAELEVELAVLRGAAELVNDEGRTPIRAGERAFARLGVAPSYAYVFNSASWDAFDRWSEERRDHRLGLSTQYLPDQVRPYARTFDSYGAWRHEPAYGHVWYPTVSVGWRPYYHGRWASLRPWGWTWIGTDPWAWATHHYGRWGFSAGAWFWIPGRRWGPAWVSWAYAPGYVSWCPLGWDNRPIVQIVNVYHRGYDPWSAWTVVPRRHFGGRAVHANVVSRHVIDTRLRGAFVHRNTAPEIVGHAVPRSTVPIRVAGTRRDGGDPRRAGDPTVFTNLDPANSRVRTPGRRVTVGAPPASTAPRAMPRASAGGSASPRSDGGGGSAPRERAMPRTDVAPGSARERAMPRSPDVEMPRATPRRPAVRSLPRGDSGRVDGNSEPSRRAMPRSPDVEMPRATPQRPAVRSLPRGDGGRVEGNSEPSRRAMPRAAPPAATPVPRQPELRNETPTYRRAPSRGPESSIDRSDPGAAARPAMRAPDRSIERSAPASPSSPPPGWRAVPRSDPAPRSDSAPRSGPARASPYRGGADRPAAGAGAPSGGSRAVPRAAPAPGSGPSQPRAAPAARPRGGGSSETPASSPRRR